MRKINLNTVGHLNTPNVNILGPGQIAVNHTDGDIMILKDETATGGSKRVVRIKRAFNLYEVADVAARDALFAAGKMLPLDMCEYTNSSGKLQLDTLLDDHGSGVWDILEVHTS